MFKEIIHALKSHNQLTECLNIFNKMIKDNAWMFNSSIDSLNDINKQELVKSEIYDRDIIVNKAERKIRKKIMVHLSSNNLKDTPFCLILMSVVKDAERIGDYCKNLFWASELFKGCDNNDSYFKEVLSIGQSIQKTFSDTSTAFNDSDQELAKDIINTERNICKRCDSLVTKISQDTQLETNKAVCFALFTRFMKRVSAHLSNIATTVVMPLHKIDYYDE